MLAQGWLRDAEHARNVRFGNAVGGHRLGFPPLRVSRGPDRSSHWKIRPLRSATIIALCIGCTFPPGDWDGVRKNEVTGQQQLFQDNRALPPGFCWPCTPLGRRRYRTSVAAARRRCRSFDNVAVEHRLMASKLLPAIHRDIDISRRDFNRVAHAAGYLSRDYRRARAAERLVDGLPGRRIILDRPAHALDRLLRAVAGFLYDKISREDILAHAYAQCRSNKGAPGVDGQDFADIEAYGVQRWLGELALALRQETYRPDPIRRVFIPKANGKLRPLGISTVRDRVCMTATMLVLEPIFEADLPPEIYAYRAGRNAQQAAVEVRALLHHGHPEVVDADLADYFGSIPHAELLKSVARRIVDRRVLHLIKLWLECAVEETDDRGRKTRTTEARDNRRGIPQGSPISPLLANLYMRRFVLGWKMLGLERRSYAGF